MCSIIFHTSALQVFVAAAAAAMTKFHLIIRQDITYGVMSITTKYIIRRISIDYNRVWLNIPDLTAVTGQQPRYTLNLSAVHREADIAKYDLELQINSHCISLDNGRKSKYPGGTHIQIWREITGDVKKQRSVQYKQADCSFPWKDTSTIIPVIIWNVDSDVPWAQRHCGLSSVDALKTVLAGFSLPVFLFNIT